MIQLWLAICAFFSTAWFGPPATILVLFSRGLADMLLVQGRFAKKDHPFSRRAFLKSRFRPGQELGVIAYIIHPMDVRWIFQWDLNVYDFREWYMVCTCHIHTQGSMVFQTNKCSWWNGRMMDVPSNYSTFLGPLIILYLKNHPSPCRLIPSNLQVVRWVPGQHLLVGVLGNVASGVQKNKRSFIQLGIAVCGR